MKLYKWKILQHNGGKNKRENMLLKNINIDDKNVHVYFNVFNLTCCYDFISNRSFHCNIIISKCFIDINRRPIVWEWTSFFLSGKVFSKFNLKRDFIYQDVKTKVVTLKKKYFLRLFKFQDFFLFFYRLYFSYYRIMQ